MVGWGMELPAGSRITTEGAIALVKSGNNNAKPRFCVACDYIDVVTEGGFWEFFRMSGGNTFEMKPHWEKIHSKLNQKVKDSLIDNVTLYPIDGGTLKPVNSNTSSSNGIVRMPLLQNSIDCCVKISPRLYHTYFLTSLISGRNCLL